LIENSLRVAVAFLSTSKETTTADVTLVVVEELIQCRGHGGLIIKLAKQ